MPSFRKKRRESKDMGYDISNVTPRADQKTQLALTTKKEDVADATKKEVQAINDLIRQSAGDYSHLRERRRSRDFATEHNKFSALSSTTPRVDHQVSPNEMNEVNTLLRRVSSSGLQGALRERRRSFQDDPKPPEHTSTGAEPKSPVETRSPAVSLPESSPEPSPSVSPARSPVLAPRERVLSVSLDGTGQKLNGAAARGARAAELQALRDAAKEIGGVFLMKEEWESMRFELNALRATNRRLVDERIKSAAEANRSPAYRRSSLPSFSPLSALTGTVAARPEIPVEFVA
jgi:hypothetical protein